LYLALITFYPYTERERRYEVYPGNLQNNHTQKKRTKKKEKKYALVTVYEGNGNSKTVEHPLKVSQHSDNAEKQQKILSFQ
jgi:hypothetical protein